MNMKSLKQKSCKLKVKSMSTNVEGNVVIGYQCLFLPANYNLPRITFFLSTFFVSYSIKYFPFLIFSFDIEHPNDKSF